jgi:FAD:protein FMN transferase
MGTVVTIDVYGEPYPPNETAYSAFARAKAILHDADRVFSTWKAGSPLNRLRRGEITLEQAPVEVAEVLELCRSAREISRGWFDPWAIPGGVDPTGYVKGWAAQRALDALVSDKISGALLNAAGDIASFGVPERGAHFRIGIVDPFAPSRLACVIELVGAVATSGTYERGAHLFNPFSQRPEARLASASVTGPDLGLADALATALVVAGKPGLQMIDELDGYEALAIGFDGTRRWTEHFPFVSPTPLPSRRTLFTGLQLPPGYMCVSS